MKQAIAILLLLVGCSWREQGRQKQRTGALPPALVRQILADQYSGSLPGRVLIDVQDWNHHAWDLNGDGKADYVIEQEDPYFCGSGGCGTLVYVSAPGGYRSVYSGGCFYSECAPLPFKTNGFQDLIFKDTTARGETYYTSLWFDGQQYCDKNTGTSESE